MRPAPLPERHKEAFNHCLAPISMNNAVWCAHYADMLARPVRVHPKKQDIARNGAFSRDRRQPPACRREELLITANIAPIGRIAGRGFRFTAVKFSPDTTDKPKTVRPRPAHAGLMLIGRIDPCLGDAQDIRPRIIMMHSVSDARNASHHHGVPPLAGPLAEHHRRANRESREN